MPAATAGEFNFFQIPLIYWENFAHLRTTESVGKTFSLPRQHRAGEKQITADAALAAVALAVKKLTFDVVLSKMNQPKTPGLAGGMHYKK
jgi:hypothetical protein